MGMGETVTLPVDVHNWSTTHAERHGDDHRAGRLHARRDRRSRTGRSLRAPTRRSTSSLTNTDTTLPGAATNDPGTTTLQKTIGIATSYSTPASSASENLTMTVAPGDDDPGGGLGAGHGRPGGRRRSTPGPALDLSRKWSGGACSPAGVDCGTAGAVRATRPRPTARSPINGDNLYFFVHIRDEFQSYAVTPDRVRRALARRLGRVPDRPARQLVGDELRHGHDVQAGRLPVHERPVELQRQRRERPVLGARRGQPPGLRDRPARGDGRRRPERPGRPGRLDGDVGRQRTTTTVDHSYGAAGGYNLEVKIPLADLPSAVGPTVDPAHGQRGDEHDRPAAPGVQHHAVRRGQHGRGGHDDAAAHRPEHAARLVERHRRRPGRSVPLGPRLRPGLHAAGGSPDDADDAERLAPEPRRRQLAADDLPVGARRRADLGPQAGARRATSITGIDVRADRERGDVRHHGDRARAPRTSSSGPATTGRSRCSSRPAPCPTDPPQIPDYGLSACAMTDGGIPPWSPDMSGRVIRSVDGAGRGGRERTSRSRSTPPPTPRSRPRARR